MTAELWGILAWGGCMAILLFLLAGVAILMSLEGR